MAVSETDFDAILKSAAQTVPLSDERNAVLQPIDASDKKFVPQTIELMKTQSAENVGVAVDVLRQMGPGVAPVLTRHLGSDDQFVQGGVIAALTQIGAPAVKPILKSMVDGDPLVVGGGRAVISAIGKPASAHLRLAADPAHELHSSDVVDLLIEVDPRAQEFLGTYQEVALASEDQTVAGKAILAFVKMGPNAAPQLLTMLDDPNPYLQQNATSALVGMGEGSVAILIDGLAAESQLVQQNSYQGLLRIGRPAAEQLQRAANSDNQQLIAHGSRLLGELGLEVEAPAQIEEAATPTPSVAAATSGARWWLEA